MINSFIILGRKKGIVTRTHKLDIRNVDVMIRRVPVNPSEKNNLQLILSYDYEFISFAIDTESLDPRFLDAQYNDKGIFPNEGWYLKLHSIHSCFCCILLFCCINVGGVNIQHGKLESEKNRVRKTKIRSSKNMNTSSPTL